MLRLAETAEVEVHCRTGSSEIDKILAEIAKLVHCRTGSSEKHDRADRTGEPVHCRTGSSENDPS